jgi:hypothetical protein
VQDGGCRGEHHDALEHGREVLGLLVPVGVIGVGRHGAMRSATSAVQAATTLMMVSGASE